DLEAAILLHLRLAGDEGLGVDDAPVAKTRLGLHLGDVLDEGLLIDRREEAGAFEIGGDDLRDVAPDLLLVGRGADHVRDGDRQGLDLAAGDVDAKLALHRRWRVLRCGRTGRRKGRSEGKGAEAEEAPRRKGHSISLGLKTNVKLFQ